MIRVIPLVAIMLIFLPSCGDNTPSATPPASTSASTSPTSDPGTTQSTVPMGTKAPPTTIDLPDSTTTSLQGGPIDFGPHKGEVLAVVGVSHDDTLNLRQNPGPNHQVLATIDPNYAGLVALGETWDTSEALWIRVDFAGTPGWVHFSFVAYLGHTADVTSVVTSHLGEHPVAATMEDLGLIVSKVYESQEPPSRVVMTGKATSGEVGEVTFDVIGLGDDAVYGVRVRVLGETTSDGVALKAVEMTSLCARGVGDHELCV